MKPGATMNHLQKGIGDWQLFLRMKVGATESEWFGGEGEDNDTDDEEYDGIGN